MYIPGSKHNPLNYKFGRYTQDRYVIDSDQFWRKEFHPRFADLYTTQDFNTIITAVNNDLSFPLTSGEISRASEQLMNWLSGYRFAGIPTKNPHCISMFEGELYFALKDILAQVSFSDYKLEPDDFNVVGNVADSGKNDRSRINVDEANKQGSSTDTAIDYNARNTNTNQHVSSIEHVGEENNSNTKDIVDVFVNPQNQGVSPTSTNTKGAGVDGLKLQGSDGTYTTNTTNGNQGSTDTTKRDRNSADSTATNVVDETNDIRSGHGTTTDLETGSGIEVEAITTGNYRETLDFDRAKKLQEFFDLNNGRLWIELLGRISRWILQMDISTSDTNYINYPIYD